MKRAFLALVLALPAAAQMRVMAQPNHSPLVTFRIVFTAGAAAFLRLARLFSTGGWRSLFLSDGKTIDVTNFFSP